MEPSECSSSICSSSSSSSSTSSRRSSLYSQYSSKCKRNGRRGAIQINSLGSDFTVKNGEWTLWVDTLSKNEIDSYKEAFAIFDRKCKGRIAARNLGALMRTLGRNPLEQELSDIIDEFTDRKTGQITFPEFVNIMAQKRETSQQFIRNTLDVLDKDGQGMISHKQLENDLSTIGNPLKQHEIDEMFNSLKIDDSGNIKYDELFDMVVCQCDDDVNKNKSKYRGQTTTSKGEYSISNAIKSLFGT